jgi:apolipoprotein N-acyltransferase
VIGDGMSARLAALRGARADLAALGLGAATALALPPVHVLPLLLLTIPGLIRLIDAAPSAVTAGRRGWWFGFGLNLIGLYWITEAILVEAARFWWLVPLAVPALAAVMAVFIALAAWLARLAPAGGHRLLALAGAWTLLDLARQFVATGFPWNPLGSVWELPGIAGDVMIQPAAWVGVHGLTLATLLLAGLPTLGWRARAAGLAVVALWAGAGAIRLSGEMPPPPGVQAVLVQGNVPQGQKWDRARMMGIFERYLRLTHEGVAAARGPAVVIWPETAAPFALEIDATAREMIAGAANQQTTLVGAVRFGGTNGRPRNSLFAMLAGGMTAAVYDKWHLVPFGEYQPDWLPLGVQLVPGGGFVPGPGPRTLHVPGLPPVGPLICYEAIFPGEIVDRQDRPAWLVNVTNDAWFGNSTGPRQHLAAARLRAVEEGLPLVRVANTGISAVFDARGHEVARLALNETGYLTIELPAAISPPIFARFGLWVPLVLGIVVLMAGFRTRRRAES